MWAMRVHQEGRNDLQLAAVEPTSDSALPIRAKLSGDPDIVGTWVARLIAAPLNQRATKASALPKNQKFSGAPRFYLPIRGQFQSLAGVPSALRRVPGIF